MADIMHREESNGALANSGAQKGRQEPVAPNGRRILCVTSNFPRWAGDSTTPFVLHLAQDLQRLGWRIDVLAPHAPGAAMRESIGGVKVERFRYFWPSRLQTVCYQGGAMINLKKRPIEWLKLPTLVAGEWAAVTRRLASGDYALLHTHWLLPQGFVGAVATAASKVPHVATIHGGDIFSLRGPLMRKFKRFTLKHSDRVTVNSSATEQAVLELGPLSTPVERIPMGVDLHRIAADAPKVRKARELYRRGDGPLLVFVGRIVEDKGVADLLLAVRHLSTQCPNLTALIIGDGQDRAAMEQQARELRVDERVYFTGWLQSSEVTAHLAAADIFISPSRRAGNGWIEAQGLAILEAMAAGTPTIATRLGGVVDAVLHERTGLLVDDRAADQIAAAVLRLRDEPGLRQHLATEARKLVEQHFSRQSSAAAFSRLFMERLSEGPRP